MALCVRICLPLPKLLAQKHVPMGMIELPVKDLKLDSESEEDKMTVAKDSVAHIMATPFHLPLHDTKQGSLELTMSWEPKKP